jgi:transposase
MGRALSEDLRLRAVEALLSGTQSQGAVAAQFRISRSTLQSWLRLYREQGNLSNRNENCGRKPTIATPENIELLRQVIVENPDFTYDELADAWSARIGVKVSRSLTVRHTIRLGFKLKKGLSGARNRNPQNPGTSEGFRRGLAA